MLRKYVAGAGLGPSAGGRPSAGTVYVRMDKNNKEYQTGGTYVDKLGMDKTEQTDYTRMSDKMCAQAAVDNEDTTLETKFGEYKQMFEDTKEAACVAAAQESEFVDQKVEGDSTLAQLATKSTSLPGLKPADKEWCDNFVARDDADEDVKTLLAYLGLKYEHKVTASRLVSVENDLRRHKTDKDRQSQMASAHMGHMHWVLEKQVQRRKDRSDVTKKVSDYAVFGAGPPSGDSRKRGADAGDAESDRGGVRPRMERQPRLERHNSYETMRGTVSFDSIVTKVAQQIVDKGETIEERFEWLAGAIDTGGNGSISYAEFIKRRSILSLSMEEMGKLWQPLPKDAEGGVKVTDFTAALEACVPEGAEDLWVLAGSGTTQPFI